MKKYFLLLMIITFIGCKQNKKQRIVYDENRIDTITKSKFDSKLIVDLPIKIDSTRILIFPISRVEFDKESFRIPRIKSGYKHYSLPLENLIFQNTTTKKVQKLTNESLKIISYDILRDSNKNLQNIIVYKIVKHDSNKDGKLNYDDISSLYISNLNGENFIELTENYQHLTNWKFISMTKKIYYTTVIDSNKNGQFDKDDTYEIHELSIKNLNKKVTLFKHLK